MSAVPVAHLLARIATMHYVPWYRDEDTPFCRWSTRDGCDCTVDPVRTTAAMEDGVKAVLAAVVEALEILCLGVPFAVEQLSELRRRALDLNESGETLPASFLAQWRHEWLRPLADNACSVLAHVSKIDDGLREIEPFCFQRDACPTSFDPPVPEGHVVYLMGAPGFLKIGHSSRIETRFADLRTSTPLDLSLLAVLEGSRPLERELHRRFSEHRVRGEWYLDVAEIRDFFARDYRRIELPPGTY